MKLINIEQKDIPIHWAFRTFGNNIYKSVSSAEKKAQKSCSHMKEVYIVHVAETKVIKEHWLLGYQSVVIKL